ncbi:hypothetical protein RclHR1_02380011 [Rhizophagus clarus]|uniref:SHSP domain-containing protein n=1 Tax=Rhizophagus clarus TaxID=94130 RepID=A0A2Z6R161_9GLOM|nr:hypothetical protein RclHR1_02380011 [Rhizophagus clarus]GES85711.1 hypothetical protein RCL_jg6707.t1 [Rhizophagus clarus]
MRVGFVHFNNEEERNKFYDRVKEEVFKMTIPGGSSKEIKFMMIHSQENEENNETENINKINYAIVEEPDNFKIILATPGLKRQSLKLFSLDRNIKIEEEFPSIDGTCIKNNLPVGKFSIKLTLLGEFDHDGVKVVIENGLTIITLKRLESVDEFNELNFSF